MAAAAGVFLVFGVTMFFHGLAWFLDDLLNWEDNVWVGFAIVTALLFLLAILAALLAFRLFKKGRRPRRTSRSRRRSAPAPSSRRRRSSATRCRGRSSGAGGEGVVARERTPEMIRAEIEETRRELAFSVNDLRSKVTELTNWRGQLVRNRRTALIGAAVAGFVIGGGVAATVSLITGRR